MCFRLPLGFGTSSLSRATRSPFFPLYAELIVAAPKPLSMPNLGFNLATPLLKCQLSPQCISRRGTFTLTDLLLRGCEEDLFGVLRLFFFFFHNLSMLFYILGLKIILQKCSLIPIQKVVFGGTVLGSTGFGVKTPWKMGLNPIGVMDFATDACQTMLWVCMGLTSIIII